MSRTRASDGTKSFRFPRVSGDEPFRDAMAKGEITFSPYERDEPRTTNVRKGLNAFSPYERG